jgi:hypothetical protein
VSRTFGVTLPISPFGAPGCVARICRISADVLNKIDEGRLTKGDFSQHHLSERRHIPQHRHRVTNWWDYDAALRIRSSLTVWFSEESLAG